MQTSRTIVTLLALAAVLTLGLPTAAQDAAPTLEGTQWSLTSYAIDGATTEVPPGVGASLQLQDGIASGSSGCNGFSGTYALEAAALTFGDDVTMTLRACTGDPGIVESAYLDALAGVAAWSIDGTTLQLSDGSAQTVLTFDGSTAANLSVADVARLTDRIGLLETALARVDERIDNISIAKLRERIRTLEVEVAGLRSEVARLRTSPPGPVPSTGFDAAEKVLLRAVPDRIKSRCQPRRSNLPAGTAAAVGCKPNTVRVAEMTYYLMEADQAVSLFNDRMFTAGVPAYGDIVGPGVQLCNEGVPSSIAAGGGYIGMEGCYRESDRANLRIVEQLTACKQLKAGSTQLRRPVMHVALTGPNADIKALHAWASKGSAQNMSPLIEPFKNNGGPDSPNCFSP